MDNIVKNEIYFRNLLKTNKNEKIRAKRKLSELIIDELDEEADEDSKKNRENQEEEPILSVKIPVQFTTISSPNISNDFGAEFTTSRGASCNPTIRRSILKNKRNLIDILDETQTQQAKTPEKTKKITLIEDNLDEQFIQSPNLHQKGKLNIINYKVKQTVQKKYDIDNILNDNTLELNRDLPEKSIRNLNSVSIRNTHLLNEIEIELEHENRTERTKENANLEKLSESASSLSLNDSHELTNDKLNQFISYRRAVESLIDENINENQQVNTSVDLNTTSRLNHSTNQNNITGIEWLKEKLVDETLNKTDCFNRTGGLDSINGNLFLNDNDLKKKKTKLVKNGYAEKLQKIILRQASSINFIRHNMNKEKCPFKSIKNSIIAVPFYKQASLNRQFSLLYAFNYSKTDNEFEINQQEKYIYILISNDLIENYKLFDADLKPLYFIKVYPPWKRMVLKDSKISIYFCTDLIEVVAIENDLIKDMPIKDNNMLLVQLGDFKCAECNNEDHIECKMNLFDVKNYMMHLKRSIGKDRLNSNRFLLTEHNRQATAYHHNTQNYLFVTQTDADYYVNQTIDVDTQYMRVNSILDALENIGYYGFITFKATVQRIGIVKNNTFGSTASTNATQVSHTYSSNLLKKHVLVSDKFGMFALILFPYEVNSIEESNKYQFNSVKFLEKQVLSSRENTFLYDQVRYLWEEMNQKRKHDCKSTLKTSPKFIYVFEYVNEMRSSLDCLGPSNKYLPLKEFDSLEAAYNEVLHETNVLFFDLNNVVPMKLCQTEKGYLLYFLVINDHEILAINLENLDHFIELDLINKLHENYVPVEYSYLFRNIQITKTGDEKFEINSNCYSYSETISRNTILQIENVQNKFQYLTNQTLELNSFVIITGKVMDVSEEASCFELVCSRCKHDLNSSINSDESTTEQTNKYFCESCGFQNDKPNINVKMQVVLNCSNTSLIVKVYLHYKTIEKLLPLTNILHNNEGFDISLVMDKKVGPLNAFIYDLNDTELYADELYFN